MSKFKFIEYKDEILALHKQGKTFVELAKLYKSPEDTVENAAQNIRRLILHCGETSHRKETPLYLRKAELEQYLLEGKTPKQIANLMGIKYPTVGGFIRTNYPQYTFTINRGNVHYFDIIDSYAKAYIVGFIAADGSLVKTKSTTTLTITVKYEDKAVLEFIKQEIGNEHNLLEIKRPCSFNPNKEIHHIRYSISDKCIVEALHNLGITEHKSLTMPDIIDNIPYRYRDAFIVGYFDGDGSVHIEDALRTNNRGYQVKDYSLYISIRGTKEFLSGICRHLNISESHIHQSDSIPTLAFASKRDTARFFLCYKNLPFYYKRKYDKFLTRINHPSYDKYK